MPVTIDRPFLPPIEDTKAQKVGKYLFKLIQY